MMAFVGRLHPLLIHFPIALVIAAALTEGAVILTANERWRTVAIANIRAGAVFALVSTIAGWSLARGAGTDVSSLLEWHRWLGTAAAGAAVGAALATIGTRHPSPVAVRMYRVALFSAAGLVAVAGHFGGLLVWGADFLHL